MELAGGYISEHHSAYRALAVKAGDVVVSALVEHTVLVQRTRRYNTDNSALHKTFGKRGILHLLTYSDFVALVYEPLYILLDGMVRHTAHRYARTGGKRQLQLLRYLLRVVVEHLIEVPEAVEKHTFPVLLAHFEILFKHRSRLLLRVSHFRHLFSFRFCFFSCPKRSRVRDRAQPGYVAEPHQPQPPQVAQLPPQP